MTKNPEVHYERYADMPSPSRGKSKPVLADGEMRKRVLSVRKQLGLDQRSFAQRIRASQTQVSEWENGTETPSAQKLVAIGNVAPKLEDRQWFWREAGLDFTRFREDILAGVKSERPAPVSVNLLLSDQGEVFLAPLVNKFYFGAAGQLLLDADRSIPLPMSVLIANRVLGNRDLICVKVPHEAEVPCIIAAGDVAVIDRSADPDDLVDSNFSITAIASEQTPPSIDLGSRSLELFSRIKAVRADAEEQERVKMREQTQRALDPERQAESEEEMDRAWKRVQERMELPALRLGWLRLRPAGETWTDNVAKQPSRFSLELEPPRRGSVGKSIALSDWKTGNNPNRPQVRKNIEGTHPDLGRVVVLGRVVAWFKYEIVTYPRREELDALGVAPRDGLEETAR